MGSFNPINFIINTRNVMDSFVRPGGESNTQAPLNNPASETQTSLSQATAYTPLKQAGLNSLQQKIITTVEVEQQANYIKDLLNLPRDFQSLINQIQGGVDPNSKIFAELNKLLSNGKINLAALTSLLGENSKEATQKLMMTIMTVSKMGANDVSKLKELIAMFSGANAALESNQAVKNLLLLYLPWLPLSVRCDMNLDFEIGIFDKNSNEENENGEEIIKIMVQTANFGNVLATLEVIQDNIDIFISASESFPEKEVLSKLKKESKETKVTVEKNKDPENSSHFKQNIQITASNYVSPKLILAAHSLIKIIIDVDSSQFIINEEYEG